MPGANYMGGKRNAMKARAKDTVGRQEKGHFGRQRLNPLLQGINMSRPSERGHQLDLSSSKVREKIDLAHARDKRGIDIDSATTTTTWFIPSPIHVAPCTPRSRTKIRSNNAHTSSSDGRSKVLEVLNTTEPFFLKAMKERILAMPDLACLSKEGNPERAHENKLLQSWQPKSHLENIPVTPKRAVNKDKSSNKQTSIQLTIQQSEDSDMSVDFDEQHATPDKRRLTDRSNVFVAKPSSTSNKVTRSKHSDGSSFDQSSIDEDSSRYSMDRLCSENYNEGSFSGSWSTYQRRSTSQTSEDINTVFSDWTRSPSMAYSPDEQYASGFALEYQELPTSIKLKPLTTWSTSSKDQATVYGSLFEQEDPWWTIGLILGLPGYRTEQNTDFIAVESYDQVENASDEDISRLVEPDLPNEEDISDEEPFMKDIWEMISPTYKKLSNDVGSPQESSGDFEDKERTLESEHSFREESAPGDLPSPGVREEFTGHEQRAVNDVMLIERDPYWAVEANEADVIEPQESMIDRMSRNMNQQGLDAEMGEKMNVDADLDVEMMPTDIFAVPALKEVDGRFLGPSLFDELEESD